MGIKFYMRIPILIPTTFLSLNIPLKTLMEAIEDFNIEASKQRVNLKGGNGYISKIINESENLFLDIVLMGVELKPSVLAKLMGYVIVNKATLAVEKLVIDGFEFIEGEKTT